MRHDSPIRPSAPRVHERMVLKVERPGAAMPQAHPEEQAHAERQEDDARHRLGSTGAESIIRWPQCGQGSPCGTISIERA